MTESEYASLEARVRELEDIRAINDVWYKWHLDCTGGFNGLQGGRMEALEALTEDATIEIQGLHEPGMGPKGRDEYTPYWEYYFGDSGPLPYVFQTCVASKVEVTGDTAVQRSNQLMIGQLRDHAPTVSISQRTNYFVRDGDAWKILKTTMDGGFASQLSELRGNLNQLPPEEARTPWTHPEKAGDRAKGAF